MICKLKIILLTLFLSCVFCCAAFAVDDGVSAGASVDRANVLIGDRVKLVVEIGYRVGIEIIPPKFKENRIGDFEIKDTSRKIRKSIFGNDIMSLQYIIAAYSTGKHEIPPIDVKYKLKNSKPEMSVQTKPLNITVESVLPKGKDSSDIKDVKGPLSYFEINWLVIGGAIFALAVIALIILLKTRKRPAPERLPHETALEELEGVRANFLKGGDIKDYYAGTSDCVRRYIERSFRLKAPEMTTEEFLGSLHESTILSLDQKDLLKNFLNACDMVKFAKYTPAKGEMESVFLAAKKFIEETKEAFSKKSA